MGLLFGFIKILVLLALVSVIVLGAILLAKKIGFLPGKDSKTSYSGYLLNFSIFKNPIMVRFCIISVLVVLMSVPLSMVSDIVKERSVLYHCVLGDIAGTWDAVYIAHVYHFSHI